MNVSNYIKVKDGGIDARLDVFFYENDGFMIAFAPALDLMGYGKTVDDAKASFEIVIEDFFEYSLENNTLIKYLEKMGIRVYLSCLAIFMTSSKGASMGRDTIFFL